MRFGSDTRGRVPFALVGVVLLLSSTAFAAALQARSPPTVHDEASRALTEATATARTDLSMAAAAATRAAARAPLVVPANTTYGRVVNRSTPFRDALRIRLYAAARDALAGSETRVGETTAMVSLPAVTDATSLRAAKRRVELVDAGHGWLRVRVEELVARARRGGRPVASRKYTATLTVGTPILTLHRNATAFERRLNASPTDGGLGAALTTRLAALTWTRGYAQYGGAPIGNVLANRHVALATNDAVLALQRATFGRADPAGRRALWRAAVRAGATDLSNGVRALAQSRVNASLPAPSGGSAGSALARRWAGASPRNRSVRVGVNRSADAAFLDVAGDGDYSLNRVLDRVYSLDAHLAVRVRTVTDATHGRRSGPDGWRLVDVSRSRSTRVRSAAFDGGPPKRGFRRLDAFGRRVVRQTRVRRAWRNGSDVRHAESVHRTVTRVSVAVDGRLAPIRYAPRRPFGRDGAGEPFGGVAPEATRRAVERLVAAKGGEDALARRAVRGGLDANPVTVRVKRPDGVRERTLGALRARRRRLRNVSVRVERRKLLAANPPEQLNGALAARRDGVVNAPGTYRNLTSTARVASRGAYLAALRHRLRRRAGRERSLRERLHETLRTNGALPPAELGGVDAGGAGRSTVVATPSYLTVGSVETDAGRRIHPLTARNLNVFSVPYGAAADAVTDAVLDRSANRTSLRVAARALREANRAGARSANATLADARSDLRGKVSVRVAAIRQRAVSTLSVEAPGLTAAERRDAVEDALSRWSTTSGRALAATNGSLARAVADAAPVSRRRSPVVRSVRRLRLRLALDAAFRGGSVAQGAVAAAGTATRGVARRFVRTKVESGLRRVGDAAVERWLNGALTAVPAGLPVTPVPGYWYATMNAWRVEARGRYAAFAVRAPASGPLAARNVTYVRRDAPVAVDVDGDGRPERLGRNAPIRFAVETAVVVVVPPGGSGVGDVAGGRDERSSGWADA